MNDKVWVITLSRGQYEDFVTWVHGVYSTEEAAVAEAERIDRIHYKSEEEYNALPLVYKDRWENGYNIADILTNGTEDESDDKFATSSLFFENSKIPCEVVEIPKNEHNYRYVRKDFLETFGVKPEDIPHLIDLSSYSDRAYAPYPCTIYSFNLNSTEQEIHPVYDGYHNPVIDE